ncbi:ATP-binding protein, partial [Mammaliicoccus sciuri]|nr:ATP-binding protein [Mammaliicoccus sciuri]
MESFTNIESLPFGILQILLFTILLAITQNYRYSKRDYVILSTGYMIPSLAFYYIFGMSAIVYVCLFYFIFFYKKFRLLGIINTLVVILISVVSDYMSVFITKYLIDSLNNVPQFFLYYMIFHST